VLLVLLTAGSVFSAWLIHGEREQTLRAYEREQKRAAEAEQQFRIARQSVNDLFQLTEEELADNPPVEGLRKRLMEAALAYYQQFIEQRRDDPDTRAELVDMHNRVNAIIHNLALLEGDRQLALLNEKSVLDDVKPTAEQREQLAELLQQL